MRYSMAPRRPVEAACAAEEHDYGGAGRTTPEDPARVFGSVARGSAQGYLKPVTMRGSRAGATAVKRLP